METLFENTDAEPVSRVSTNGVTKESYDENLYLIGRPTLKQFLRFVRSHAVNAPAEGELVKEWQEANAHLQALQKEEGGIADNPHIAKLDIRKHEHLLSEFFKDPLIQNGFNTVPTDVAIVELDRLIVYQHHIDLTYVRELEKKLGPAPNEEQIFRTCLLHDHPQPQVKWSRVHHNTWVFMSPSNDMRYLSTLKLHPGNIKDYPLSGTLAGAVGLAVGFGSNFLNAVYAENRLILNNGSHRAYALRKIGVTHVPCIIQHVNSRDQLDVVAASDVTGTPDYYLRHPRPSLLKDYFDPRLHKVFQVKRLVKQIVVKFEIDDGYVPAL
ncbi:MAG: hypothetical protein HYV29_16045 [Ignavibacteriales bacterium]|nr:hypothetical protein [Ignavibacteriales bacterium]